MAIADDMTSQAAGRRAVDATTPVRIEHRRDLRGWSYTADGLPVVQGGGGTLAASVAAAEHAVRYLLSKVTGRDVALGDARRLIQHVRTDDHDPSTRRDSR